MKSAARRNAEQLLIAAALVSVAATLAASVALQWWLFDLVSNFRLQLAAGQLVVALALLAAGRKRWAAVLLPLLVLNIYSVWPYLARAGTVEVARTGPVLSLLTVNVAADNTRFSGLGESIERASPDVVLIVEFTPRWAQRLRELAASYAYRLELPEDGAGGIALWSRHPLVESRARVIGRRSAIDAVVATPTGPLRVVGVHFSTPVTGPGARRRASELEQTAALLAEPGPPTVLMGDFNLSVFSPHFSRFLRETGFRDPLAGRGPNISWPTFFPLLGIPIDHCLTGPGIEPLSHRRLPAFGSDHYPILVEIVIRAEARVRRAARSKKLVSGRCGGPARRRRILSAPASPPARGPECCRPRPR